MAKQEIDETRKILKAQTELTQLQQKSQAKQLFETTFFRTLELFVRLTSELGTNGQKRGDRSGKDVFRHYLTSITNGLSNGETANDYYDQFYGSHSSELGHYFRVLYNLIRLVDESDMDDKRFYTNLIRANLSDDEALILYLNGLSEPGKLKFKPLMERYALLKNVDKTHVLYLRSENTYDAGAF